MAEVARRAGVGMATLYRNFPGRRELLEALFTDDVDDLVAAAGDETFAGWVRRFVAFKGRRHVTATLLSETEGGGTVLDSGRDRVLAAGRPLLEAAQAAGDVRADLSLEQVLDMVLAIARIQGDDAYVEPILDAAIAGLRP
jgi:AcrR family transcriptional regulator